MFLKTEHSVAWLQFKSRVKQATGIDLFSFDKNRFESTFNELWVCVFFNFISSWVIVWQIATSVRPVILTHFFFSVYKGLLVCLFISTQWGQKLYDVAFNTWFTLSKMGFLHQSTTKNQNANYQFIFLLLLKSFSISKWNTARQTSLFKLQLLNKEIHKLVACIWFFVTNWCDERDLYR